MRPSGHEPVLLLIAIGNTLRRDDGAGVALAARLEPLLRAASVPVRVEPVHQLAPELAEDVSHAAFALFLDASVDAGAPLVWKDLDARAKSAALGHHMEPEAVLAVAQALFGGAPPAALLTARGADFHHGEGLSPEAAEAVARVDDWVSKILEEYHRGAGIRPRPSPPSADGGGF